MAYGSKARKARRAGLKPRSGAVGYQCPIIPERIAAKTRYSSVWVPFSKVRFEGPSGGNVDAPTPKPVPYGELSASVRRSTKPVRNYK